jgi:hypothetical protein
MRRGGEELKGEEGKKKKRDGKRKLLQTKGKSGFFLSGKRGKEKRVSLGLQQKIRMSGQI